MAAAPEQIIETPQLVLRCWQPDDAPLLKAAVDMSLDHLREWLPWAMNEPSSLEEVGERIAGYRDSFESGEEFIYGIFNPGESEVYGGVGLHARIGPNALELGYWIRVDQVQNGFATEVAEALTRHALDLEVTERIEIRCDPLNLASVALPRNAMSRSSPT
jgi:RimJ/RimL family protein N-acetyltransferase